MNNNVDEILGEVIDRSVVGEDRIELFKEAKTKLNTLIEQERLRAVREERLHNTRFLSKKLQPLIDQLDHDEKAMLRELQAQQDKESDA